MDTFTISREERDALVRQAVFAAEAEGEAIMGASPPEQREHAGKVVVLHQLLGQLGWDVDGCAASYGLDAETLPLEQLRVWVAGRFLDEAESWAKDCLTQWPEERPEALQRISALKGLEARLEAARPSVRRAPCGRTPAQVEALSGGAS